jgi:cytolysin (calcineurin-like family phosphatase)
MILKIIGIPSEEDLEFIDNEHAMNWIQREKKQQLAQNKEPVNWKKRIPHASDEALSLLK